MSCKCSNWVMFIAELHLWPCAFAKWPDEPHLTHVWGAGLSWPAPGGSHAVSVWLVLFGALQCAWKRVILACLKH